MGKRAVHRDGYQINYKPITNVTSIQIRIRPTRTSQRWVHFTLRIKLSTNA